MAPIYFIFFFTFFYGPLPELLASFGFFFYRVLLEFRRLGEVDLRSTSTEFYGVFFFFTEFYGAPVPGIRRFLAAQPSFTGFLLNFTGFFFTVSYLA